MMLNIRSTGGPHERDGIPVRIVETKEEEVVGPILVPVLAKECNPTDSRLTAKMTV